MPTVALLKDTLEGETRVALVPESVAKLTRSGTTVRVERGAGLGARLPDDVYEAAGAVLAEDAAAACADADVVVRVRRPDPSEAEILPGGCTLVSLLQPGPAEELLRRLGERGITCLALERVPRITRAQSMDVLSSQATVAGYKAVLLGAGALDKFLPMLTTAAGSISPAKAFVIGAGVAGLQAIATARRLGAVVSAFDIRPAAAEQVKSLGATFVAAEAVSAAAEASGGYARAQSEDEQERTRAALARHVRDMDLVISTAQVPGRPAPRLITEEMVAGMRPGSVIVDVAAENGGNCTLTRPGETVQAHGVTILGPTNLAATVPLHASQMFSRNVLTLLQHLIRDGELHLNRDDEIVAAMRVETEASVSR
ncbi:MAG TPA: Re/Si-specific NAD(P)(+) transhydrogenase subunit alpha [Longimicrobiaceae bacterium]|nr:Re/Si-specific NAD(P)(+) transhydrogenase subunit alpha [Longimicrobiaceae bacterium]